MRGVSSVVLRRLVWGGGLLAVAIVAFVVLRGGAEGNSVFVTVPKATGVISGQYIKAAGTEVGKVKKIEPVDGGRAARLELEVDDEVWPLPADSKFTLRWGGTINLYNRYVDLKPGTSNETLADGGELKPAAFAVPVAYGELLNVFGTDARADLKDLLDRGGVSLDRAGPTVSQALDKAPPAIRQADAVLGELNRSRADVEALILSTGRVVDSVQRSDPGLAELIQGAGTTLDALGDEATTVQATLDAAPGTLRKARGTLDRADPTLIAARRLTDKLGPGVTKLRQVASPLNRLLGTLTEVTPLANGTLRTAGAAAPDLTTLVNRLGKTAPQLSSIATQSTEALMCIRPYSPEIASFGTLWTSALAGVDGAGKYIRATPTVSLPAPTMLERNTSEQAKKNFPGLEYAFPRPPGTQAGQPWLLPECGAGADAFDPSKDPEARNFSELSSLENAEPPKKKGSK